MEEPCIHREYVATDACREPNKGQGPVKLTGIGYFVEGVYVSIIGTSIAEFLSRLHAAANDLQREHKSNFPYNNKSTNSHTIAYLELFCIWWLISADPERFRDKIIPIYIDNQNNKAWLVNETAPIPYLAILRPMHAIMREYKIRLYPIWIKSDANELADLASRGELKDLEKLLPKWRTMVKHVQKYIETLRQKLTPKL